MHATPDVTSTTPASRHVERELSRLRETVGRVVGSVFFGTLLKTMRESKLKGPYGHGGRGEEVFAEQLHGLLAERMGQSSQVGLQDALFDRLKRQEELISRQRLVNHGSQGGETV